MGHGVWALALVFGCLGLLLLVLSLRARRARGLGSGETVALDDVTLVSKQHLLTGRPDRIVKHGGFVHSRGMEVREESAALAPRPAWGLLHPD